HRRPGLRSRGPMSPAFREVERPFPCRALRAGAYRQIGDQVYRPMGAALALPSAARTIASAGRWNPILDSELPSLAAAPARVRNSSRDLRGRRTPAPADPLS